MGECVCYSAGKAVGVVGSRCETISFPGYFPVFKLGFYFSGGGVGETQFIRQGEGQDEAVWELGPAAGRSRGIPRPVCDVEVARAVGSF